MTEFHSSVATRVTYPNYYNSLVFIASCMLVIMGVQDFTFKPRNS